MVPNLVGPFSIVQWVKPLAYWLNLGTFYVKYIQSFISLLLSLFLQVVMDIRIQHLCRSKMSKSWKSVGYFGTKVQVEKGSIWLHFKDIMNINLVGYLTVNLAMLWRS